MSTTFPVGVRRPRLRLTAAVAAGAALAWVAVGAAIPAAADTSSGSTSSQSAAQIAQSAVEAMGTLTSVAVKGTIVEGKQRYTINVQTSSSGTAQGTVSANGQSIQIIKDGDTAYFKGSKKLLQSNGLSAAQAAKFANVWFSGSSSAEPFTSFSSFLDTTQLLSGLSLTSVTANTTWTKAGTASVNGQPAVVVAGKGTGKKAGGAGKLYVASTGTPYILRMTAVKGTGQGQLTFSAFNQPVTVTPPPNPVDISQLSG